MDIEVKDANGAWRQVAPDRNVKALVFLNLQSYAGTCVIVLLTPPHVQLGNYHGRSDR